jgi:hypothetical protein
MGQQMENGDYKLEKKVDPNRTKAPKSQFSLLERIGTCFVLFLRRDRNLPEVSNIMENVLNWVSFIKVMQTPHKFFNSLFK